MATESLGVSRAAYREAVQTLIAKGLVESRPKAGTRVLPRDRWNLLDPDVLAWAFAREPDQRLIDSLFELRGIIEPASAALAAERRSREDLQQMKSGLALMRRHTLATEEGRQGDRQFPEIFGDYRPGRRVEVGDEPAGQVAGVHAATPPPITVDTAPANCHQDTR